MSGPNCPDCGNGAQPFNGVLSAAQIGQIWFCIGCNKIIDTKPRPKRVQFNRFKGEKLPPNTVLCTRPGKWGNPFKISSDIGDLPFVVAKRMTGELGDKLTRTQALEAFKIWCNHHVTGREYAERAKKELRGKDLACTCSLEKECHCDYLLKVANQ